MFHVSQINNWSILYSSASLQRKITFSCDYLQVTERQSDEFMEYNNAHEIKSFLTHLWFVLTIIRKQGEQRREPTILQKWTRGWIGQLQQPTNRPMQLELQQWRPFRSKCSTKVTVTIFLSQLSDSSRLETYNGSPCSQDTRSLSFSAQIMSGQCKVFKLSLLWRCFHLLRRL